MLTTGVAAMQNAPAAAAKAELARREELAKIGLEVTDTDCTALPTDTLERAKINSHTDWKGRGAT